MLAPSVSTAVAKSLNIFLMTFQADIPMVTFLAQSIEEIIRNYASSFLLKEILSNSNSCLHLSKIDFKDLAKQKRLVDVELNVGVKLELSHLQKSGKVNTNQVLGFKRDVANFLSTLCSHFTEKSPIKFPLTWNSRFFIPNLLVESPKVSEMRYKHLLENLASMNHIGHVKFLEKLVKVLKIILALSHRQASVDRGFSFNKSLPVENLSVQSLVSPLLV